jgi:AMIN domain
LPRLGSQASVCLLWTASIAVATLAAFGQSPATASGQSNSPSGNPQSAVSGAPALVQSVQMVQDRGGLAVEILSSRPVRPSIQTLDNPPRVVVDLIGASNGVKRKRTPVQGEVIRAIRVDQYQASPPVTRVVIDLVAKQAYSWDVAGNRLMVRLKPAETKVAEVPTLGTGAKPPVVPVVPGGGNVVLAGSRLSTGSSITAGADTAILHIARGGEVWVCPGSTVSVTTSPNGQDLMLGVSTGAFEAHYALGASADSILTPDFRILMPGPGEFDFALSADAKGDTCVRALMGNTASVVVSELMGDRTYQVKPTEQVVFRGGRIEKISNDVPLECGCPPPKPGVMRASAPVVTHMPAHVQLGDDTSKPAPTPANDAELASEGQPAKSGEVQMRVEAPLVFRADPSGSGAPVAAALKVEMYPRDLRMQTPVLPPGAAEPGPDPAGALPQPAIPADKPVQEHKGFFGGIKGFFAAIFR